jgi:serine/threonine-protein kinase
MDDKTQRNTENDVRKEDDFNPTIIIDRPARAKIKEVTRIHKIAASFGRKKQEIEDIIGKNNVDHYTASEPDTSSELNAPLSNLDTRYSLLEEFATGGHATVSIARDKNLRRIVAIKSLNEESGKKPERFDSFISEAKVTAQLDHPSIIPIYGLSGDDRNGVHLIMKLVNGKTLRDYLRNIAVNYRVRGIKNFDEEGELGKRLEIFLRVCDAIAYAHHRKIMHRDLKPENIMLGEYMEVYVMDWGLAKMIPKDEEPIDDAKQLAGTPRYFSPEALRGERCDARADIFTLGLILQEVVTLQCAVKGRDERECMERIVGGDLEPVKHLFRWKIDRSLKAIIRKATAYRVEDRYQSVNELADDLRRYMGGLSISALPDDAMMRTARYFSRHRKGFLIAFMALLFGSAALTAFAIHRQLKFTREMTLQRRALNFIYNRTAIVAKHLDVTALHIQEQLSALSRIAAYLLSCNTQSKDADWVKSFHPPMDKMKRTEAGVFYSPYYKRLVGLDYGIYTIAPNADQTACIDFIRRVAPALSKMKMIVLGSRSGYNFAQEDYGKLKAEYLYKGFPIRSVFIGSESGAKLLYPWRGNYSRNIDPRQRAWYRNALNQSGPVWGKPYMDIDSVSGLSIPCSIQIFDLEGNFRGVAGLDLSVNRLTNSILTKGNVGDYVLEKAVINLSGETIFSTKSEYFNQTFDPDKYHQNAEFKTPLFQTEEIRKRILGQGKDYGVFSVTQDGEKLVFSFARLEIFDMYYVVVADYDKLLTHIGKMNR